MPKRIKEKWKERSLFMFKDKLPQLLVYQLVTKALLLLSLVILRTVAGSLLWVAGKPAITSSDIPFLMRTWQGWLLLIIALTGLFIYTIFDINVMILLSRNVLYSEHKKMKTLIYEAFLAGKKLIRPKGILVILYISFLAPACFATLGISLSYTFVLPDFILSVITSTSIRAGFYYILLILLGILGLYRVFTFHYMILKDQSLNEALASSVNLIKVHKRSIAGRYFGFLLRTGLVLVLIFAVFGIVPYIILEIASPPQYIYRFFLLLIVFVTTLLDGIYGLLFLSFQFMRLTQIFDGYECPDLVPSNDKKHFSRKTIFISVLVIVLMCIFSAIGSSVFDRLFSVEKSTQIIAHRGGGRLSTENTLESIQAAIDKKVYASEIDVQRTRDGHYIIHHDTNFSRLYGDIRRPEDMKLDEVKSLTMKGLHNKIVHPATLEEALETARDKIHLYIELKGRTADRKMVEDLYRMVKAKGMLDQCAFISLDYDIINYMESKHPDAETIYLCYYSFGDIGRLNVDGIGLEAESATDSNIRKIHKYGKRVDVWTCNVHNIIMQFLMSDVDGIITDEVESTQFLKNTFKDSTDINRIINWLRPES